MGIYRAVWAIAMVFIVAPAFLLASSTELNNFHETSIQALMLLEDWYVPHYLAMVFGYPIAVMATILPGSSTLIPFLGDMIWKNVGVIFLAIALFKVDPPFYKPSNKEV